MRWLALIGLGTRVSMMGVDVSNMSAIWTALLLCHHNVHPPKEELVRCATFNITSRLRRTSIVSYDLAAQFASSDQEVALDSSLDVVVL
jgi:hypothetical protein